MDDEELDQFQELVDKQRAELPEDKLYGGHIIGHHLEKMTVISFAYPNGNTVDVLAIPRGIFDADPEMTEDINTFVIRHTDRMKAKYPELGPIAGSDAETIEIDTKAVKN